MIKQEKGINYELAKALKEAGFPQDDRLLYWKTDDTEPYEIYNGSRYKYSKGIIECASPTLEEILDELGLSFYGLHQNRTLIGKAWVAQKLVGRKRLSIYGESPIIAAANLYLHLALHKK